MYNRSLKTSRMVNKTIVSLKISVWAAVLLLPILVNGQDWQGKFEQIDKLLHTPNSYRTASGQPGNAYWQPQVDYKIKVRLDESTKVLSGQEVFTFHNNSPHTLTYLWVQLDQNVRKKNSLTWRTDESYIDGDMEAEEMMRLADDYFYEGGYKIKHVLTASGEAAPHTLNETMMRIDLAKPLQPGEQVSYDIAWEYTVYDRLYVDGRGGYEYFPKDDNHIFTIAQWYPRLAVYDDVEGWQNKQFLGAGEFALSLGDFDVEITVPDDHIVASTGELMNPREVLSETQQKRLKTARAANKPVFIVNEKEARKNEKSKSTTYTTWHFTAKNVRDFAFASSRKFIWDAMKVDLETNDPMAMSYYPKEGNPLWEEHSTWAVANTLETYSRLTFDYPYPVAISVHAADQGMEYPMICFNMGRPGDNGKYSKWKLHDMVAVIVHEVGHNYFPMIVNSDERQWTWHDEGINTFLEQLTMDEHYPEFGLTWGKPKSVVKYMRGNPDYIRPIMTNSEQVVQFGYNGYGKPSAALCVLRDVVMGPELFDYAFKTYANRWAFKRPKPADFLRTMEDASAVDLDWFWRGWFYTIEHVDINLANIAWFRVAEDNPEAVMGAVSLEAKNNLLDEPIPLYLSASSERSYGEFRARIEDNLVKENNLGKNLYELTFKNEGGLVSPIIIEWNYADGSSETEIIPAEIWRMNENEVVKVFAKEKQVVSVRIDPEELTGDTYTFNNNFPRIVEDSRIDKFKTKE